MAIGGPPAGTSRPKEGTKGAAGRYGFVAEAARGYLGTLWLARDPADSTERGTVFVRHIAPLVAASARAAILEGGRWAQTARESDGIEIIEARTAVDVVTPFVDAEPLRALLRTAALKHASMDPAVIIGMVRGVVTELAPLHERGREAKSPHAFGGVHPDSIFLGPDGKVHFLDVGTGGAASLREPWRSDPQRIGYFAPEQMEARSTADARTDVFALGILLWEALTNRRLFPGNDVKTARERAQKSAIARLDATRPSGAAGISSAIADVVARALDRNPNARFQSLEDFGSALSALDGVNIAGVGAWVSSLADTAIAKRRQFLERVSIPPPARASMPPARPSTAPSLPVPGNSGQTSYVGTSAERALAATAADTRRGHPIEAAFVGTSPEAASLSTPERILGAASPGTPKRILGAASLGSPVQRTPSTAFVGTSRSKCALDAACVGTSRPKCTLSAAFVGTSRPKCTLSAAFVGTSRPKCALSAATSTPFERAHVGASLGANCFGSHACHTRSRGAKSAFQQTYG